MLNKIFGRKRRRRTSHKMHTGKQGGKYYLKKGKKGMYRVYK